MQEGFGPMDMSVDWKLGKRSSAFTTYITNAPDEIRGRIEVKTTSLVCGLEMDAESNFTGVKVKTKSGEEVMRKFLLSILREIIRPTNEIILSAGAIGSPQILELSGVGDPAVLLIRSFQKGPKTARDRNKTG